MKIYTIGFTKKNAETFFDLLKKNNVSQLLDIRLNNASQLAGFTKGTDLEYFTKTILGIKYRHDIRFAPAQDLMDNYKSGKISWAEYEPGFKKIILGRDLENIIRSEYLKDLDGICLLCSEAEPDHCHRSLVAEYIKSIIDEDMQIIHL